MATLWIRETNTRRIRADLEMLEELHGLKRISTETGVSGGQGNTVMRQPISLDLRRICDIPLQKQTQPSLQIQKEVSK